MLKWSRILKILVCTPHNYGGIMGGRDKNFEDPMQSDQDIRKTRYGRRRFSSTHPLLWQIHQQLALGGVGPNLAHWEIEGGWGVGKMALSKNGWFLLWLMGVMADSLYQLGAKEKLMKVMDNLTASGPIMKSLYWSGCHLVTWPIVYMCNLFLYLSDNHL